MPATKAEIGLLALQVLKVVEGNDATPEPNDTLVIEQAYDNVYAKLLSMHLVSWGLTESVPDLFIDPVVWLIAASRITVFDPELSTIQIILANSERSIGEITKAIAMDYVPQIYPTESF